MPGVWKQVTAIENGQNVEADIINRPLSELAERTNYLRSLLIENGIMEFRSSIRFTARLKDPDSVWPGAVLCIDPETKAYVLADSRMSVFDQFLASHECFAIGIAYSIDRMAGTAVVVAFGTADISSESFTLSSMLETGELFRNGMYYLSSREPGKLTSVPEGPRVQIGVFTCNPQTQPVSGDMAFITPQYGDLLSHVHRTYELAAKPAGSWSVHGSTIDDPGHVSIDGYASNYSRGIGDGDSEFVSPRLRVGGFWSGVDEVAYEVWLSSGPSSDPSYSPAPSGFNSAYICWRSSSKSEGSGSVKVARFFQKVDVGSMGLSVSLEPGDAAEGMDDLYRPLGDVQDNPSARTWSIRMPEYGRGWSENSVDGEIDAGSLIRVHGRTPKWASEIHICAVESVYLLNVDDSMGEIVPGVSMSVVWNGDDLDDGGNPMSTTFRFVGEDGPDPGEGEIPVPISGSRFDTFSSMARVYGSSGKFAISYNQPSSIDGLGVSKSVYIGCKSVSFGDLPQGVSGARYTPTKFPTSNGSTPVMIMDQDGRCLLSEGAATFSSFGGSVTLYGGAVAYAGRVMDGEHDMDPLHIDSGSHGVVDVPSGCRGAVFRYNIEMDKALNSSFPPVPAKAGSLMLNGVELLQDGDSSGPPPVYGIGHDSLYWLSDVFGGMPWSSAYSDPEGVLPSERSFWLLFHFVTMLSGPTGPVTSLRPSEGSPIHVYRCGTRDPATVGDLEIDIDMTTDVRDANILGYKAVKTGRNGKLLLGPLVERVVAGPGILVESGAGQPRGQGTVTVSVTNASYSGEMETIALENAKEEMVGMFPYIRLLGWNEGSDRNIDTGFIARFHIPTGISEGLYKVRVYMNVFGEDSFSGSETAMKAGLRMTYNILPNWSPNGPFSRRMNVKGDVIAPDSPRVLDIPFGVMGENESYSYDAFDPIMVHNDSSMADSAGRCVMALGGSFPSWDECHISTGGIVSKDDFGVRPGYVVAVRFSRCAPYDDTSPYTGRLGITDLRWSLVKVSEDLEEQVDDNGESSADEVVRRLQSVASGILRRDMNSVNSIKRALLKIVDSLNMR